MNSVTLHRNIPLHPIQSEAISRWGYDQMSRTFVVEFHNGSVFAYANVTEKIAMSVINDEHPGKVFNQKVRDKFSFEKLS